MQPHHFAVSDVTGTVFRDSNPVGSGSAQFDYAIGEIYGGHNPLLINTPPCARHKLNLSSENK